VSEETGADEVREEQDVRDDDVERGPSAVDKAKLAWAMLPTGTKVKALVTLTLTAVGAVTVLRGGGKLARAGYRRARR
jgi:hypothetical protein